MGNIEQFGYKITKIQELSFLNLLSIKQSLNINEYIYFITKINNKTVNENINKLKQETKIIKEITLYNILTKKIYIIKDNIESEMFFNGIEIVYEKIPVIENVIRICNIFENSNANTLGLSSSNGYLIISTKNNYINCMDRLALEIKELNANFVIYNIEKDKIGYFEFEKFRIKNELKLGFECELTSIDKINFLDLDIKESVKNNLNKTIAQDIKESPLKKINMDKEEVSLINKSSFTIVNTDTKSFTKKEESIHNKEINNEDKNIKSIEKNEDKNEIDSQENLLDVKTNEDSIENDGIVLKKKYNTFDNLSKYSI